LAILTAIRLAYSRSNNFAAERRPRLVLEMDVSERLTVVVALGRA
jgi:hypothetical protein